MSLPLYTQRMKCFRQALARQGSEAFLVSKPPNLQYLAGFRGDSAWLLITEREQILITDSRYTEQARQECADWQVVEQRAGLAAALKETAAGLGLRALAVDQGHLSVETYQRLLLNLGAAVDLTAADDPCATLRQIKDGWELEQMARAAEIAAQALDKIRPLLKPGIRERELGLELDYQMAKLDSEGPSFDTIVAAGPQGALPHARQSAYRLQAGDFVTFDFGAVVGGYHSDMTRTFVLGRPDKRKTDVYQMVLAAQEKALAGIRPGASNRAVDALARGFLTEQGCGGFFGHGLGHSLGLEIHEEPRFSPLAAELALRPGQVMTVEPGLYIPGFGGVRIEDSIVVTEDGLNFLTKFPKTLEEITVI